MDCSTYEMPGGIWPASTFPNRKDFPPAEKEHRSSLHPEAESFNFLSIAVKSISSPMQSQTVLYFGVGRPGEIDFDTLQFPGEKIAV